MAVPDSYIVSEMQKYDNKLFVKWNNQHCYFEVWRNTKHGPLLVTTVTQNIYYENGKRIFTPLDQRILVWLYTADSWRSGGAKEHTKAIMQRLDNKELAIAKKRISDIHNFNKDWYNDIKAEYVTTYAKKNPKYPKFNKAKINSHFVMPDKQAFSLSRMFARSKHNALKYNFQRER